MYFKVLCLVTGLLHFFYFFGGCTRCHAYVLCASNLVILCLIWRFFLWSRIIPRRSLGVDLHVFVYCEGDHVPAQDAPQRRTVRCPPRRPERTCELGGRRVDGRSHRCHRLGCKSGHSHHPNRDINMLPPMPVKERHVSHSRFVSQNDQRQDHRGFCQGSGVCPLWLPSRSIQASSPTTSRDDTTTPRYPKALCPSGSSNISAGACTQQADPTGTRGKR